jgi:hypothetical protein
LGINTLEKHIANLKNIMGNPLKEHDEHHWERDENTRITKFHPNTSRLRVEKEKENLNIPNDSLFSLSNFFWVRISTLFTDESWCHDP